MHSIKEIKVESVKTDSGGLSDPKGYYILAVQVTLDNDEIINAELSMSASGYENVARELKHGVWNKTKTEYPFSDEVSETERARIMRGFFGILASGFYSE